MFILTAKYHVAILSYDEASGDIITRAYGDVKVIIVLLLLQHVYIVSYYRIVLNYGPGAYFLMATFNQATG